MKRLCLGLFFTLLIHAHISVRAAELSSEDLARIGRKVWKNECGGTVEGLTSWNTGEDFASLGIGHFIWYSAGARGPFDESFPKLVQLFKSRGIRVPDWLSGPCPWKSRAEFQRDADSPRMKELRKLLADTVPQQTDFLLARMEAALPKMLDEAAPNRRPQVRRNFEKLQSTARGAFALIDYVNFKGEGTLATERYKGEGWGLLQVLENMDDSQRDPVRAFGDSAKAVLTRRVQNAPPERHEERWLPGWKNRVASYAME